jgi:uncharacterized protein
MYLCHWSAAGIGLWERLLVHPRMALQNTREWDLSPLEQDIILKHMWPITLRLVPKYRESIVVSLADKLCTIVELTGVYRLLRAAGRLGTPRRVMEERDIALPLGV